MQYIDLSLQFSFFVNQTHKMTRSKVYILHLYGSYGVQEAHAVSMRDNIPVHTVQKDKSPEVWAVRFTWDSNYDVVEY